MGGWPNANKWKESYANPQVWGRITDESRAPRDHLDHLVNNHRRYQPRRILLSTEAVNAGITLPQVEWVISTMGVRRVCKSQRRTGRSLPLGP
eukprot:2232561-Amphidinium_carterae.1